MNGIQDFLKKYWILLVIVAVKFILQYSLVNPVYELHRDEFLHLDQARHPAFGYISVPPLTSLISGLIFIAGGDLFWIRFFPALFGALTIVFAWMTVETLRGSLAAKLLVSLALLFSVLVRLNILFQPNAFDILIWTAIFFLAIKYLDSGNNKWLYSLGVAVAIGLYNKYNVAFLVTGIFTGLLLTPQRRIIASSTFLKAVLLAFILFLPNITWQVAHDFPVIWHMKVLKEYQLDNITTTGFLTGQLLIFAGSFPLTMIGLASIFLYKPFRTYRFAGVCFITVMAVYAVLKAKDYYTLGLFPVIFAFAGVFIDKVLKGRLKLTVVSFLLLLNLAVFAGMVRFVMPVMSPSQITENHEIFEKTGLLRWEDGKNHDLPQDFADMTGWKEMAEKALRAYNMIPYDERSKTLVFCDNYGQAGALNYYNRGKMKEAYSFNTDYIYWLPRMDHIENVILVGEMPEPGITAMFNDFRQTGVVENKFAREKGTGIYLFSGADSSFTEFFFEEMEKRINDLDIF